VLYLENPAAVSTHLWGLPDDSFVRGEVSMTKAEIRAVVMSKLRIREKDIVYDVGAGTGSVSVEMALAARKGIVYSIESNFDALELCKLNKRRFCLENMEIVEGKAPDVLDELPAPDVVFIGGSRGKLPEIVEVLLEKNPALRLVINTITVESTASAAALLETERFADFEMVQVQVSRGKKVGASHMMLAQNTVTILSARGKK
jgi:precorrin-6Y C5,15-methyltransferase (decarboxylating)